MNEYFLTKEGAAVDSVLTVAGFSFGGHGQSSGLIFVRLKDWANGPARITGCKQLLSAHEPFLAVSGRIGLCLRSSCGNELGNATGFDFELIDRANVGHAKLMERGPTA